ncbi:Armadillo-type fold [Arabidopsis suecica]|uniref:Armadillo-type fold n=1 Tax=Arabidopsis suecica TaxID=45249 RepID=A0A8T2B7F6_ARASU|nr:Armadillo-type fold [Arabidopsis suecica]
MEKNKDLNGENLSLLLRLVISPQRMKSMIIDSPTFGVESLFTSLQFSEYMKSELAMALKNDGCLLDIFSQSSKIAPFVQNLVHVFKFDELEPLLGIIATHLLDLANKGNGLRNLRMFLKLASSPIVVSFISLVPNNVDIAYDKNVCHLLQVLIASHKPEVEAMLVQRISGFFFHFATHKYANHLVQSADDSGTDSTASFVMDSLSGDFRILMDHCYLNYVLQSIIRRSASIDLPLFY